MGNRACSSLLFLSSIGIIIPSAATQMIVDAKGEHPSEQWVLNLSRGSAIILLGWCVEARGGGGRTSLGAAEKGQSAQLRVIALGFRVK